MLFEKLTLSKLLEIYNVSVKSLAKELGISYNAVYKWIKGYNQINLSAIEKIHNALGIDYGTLTIAAINTYSKG